MNKKFKDENFMMHWEIKNGLFYLEWNSYRKEEVEKSLGILEY